MLGIRVLLTGAKLSEHCVHRRQPGGHYCRFCRLRWQGLGVKTTFGHADPAAQWHQRLADGLAHDLGLVIAKAVHGQLAAGVPRAAIVRQVALFGAQNRDGWGVGLTVLMASFWCSPAQSTNQLLPDRSWL